MTRNQPGAIDRIGAATGAVLVSGLLGYALIYGLVVPLPAAVTDALKVFSVAPPPPPPEEKVRPRPSPSRKPEGAASPPNLKSKATEVVAPPPVVPIVVPPPVVVAEKAGVGAEANSGASNVRGPGTGSGGIGNGTGSGGYGDGDGGGGEETPPEWRSGRLRDSDYPRDAPDTGISGIVWVRYTVEVSGRVSRCRATRSSGSRVLDNLTCRLIEQRFRYDPSLDAAGRPVESTIVEYHDWSMDGD
ncbi:energy transducer TonB [Sphingomonas faeni]|uniref:energy transducer TonB n=1 Tax=Sphingomonas faeni TaxID=185950 RepID=UPI003346F3F8